MTDEDKRQLSIFEARFRQLLYQYDTLRQQNEELRQQLLQKEKEITEWQERCKQAESDYANLKTARIISIGDQELADTKKRLAQLVRDVDKCIALLNG